MPSRQENLKKMKRNGQYPTPPLLVDIMAAYFKQPPFKLTSNSSACDPCCGHGNIMSKLVELGVRTAHGFDVDAEMIAATKKRVGDSVVISQRNVLVDGLPQDYDFFLLNPPFKTDWLGIASTFHTKSLHPSAQFLELCINHLTPHGRLAIILDRGFCTSRSHRATRSILLQMAHLETVIELPRLQFKEEAGTTFRTCLLFFRRDPVATTIFRKGKRIVDRVSREEMLTKTEWCYLPRAYQNHVGTRLGDFVELVNEPFNEANKLTPKVDDDCRVIVENKKSPKTKTRACFEGCLFLSRLSSGGSVRCAPITQKFAGAGVTSEYYVVRPRDARDLPWLWCTLNFSSAVRVYMGHLARGLAQSRVSPEEFLAMPVMRPSDDKIKDAEERLVLANRLARGRDLLRQVYP